MTQTDFDNVIRECVENNMNVYVVDPMFTVFAEEDSMPVDVFLDRFNYLEFTAEDIVIAPSLV